MPFIQQSRFAACDIPKGDDKQVGGESGFRSSMGTPPKNCCTSVRLHKAALVSLRLPLLVGFGSVAQQNL